MKLLVLNYTFDASEKKITLTDYNPIVIERVLLVTNITDNVIIYNFADPLKGGTAATNVLTLTFDTTSMSDTDKLQIFYDDAATTQPVSATDLDVRNLTNVDVVTAELSAVDNAVLDTIAAKDFATQTTLSALNAKLVTGTDIGDVTINNAAGAAAVNIQDGGNVITVDGTVAVTGVATEATLGTVHGHVDSIDTKTPALGQALAAASVPVILPAATITTLTPPAAITGFATAAKQLADGHTVALSATDNAVLDAIETDTSVIAGAISATHMQADVLTLPANASVNVAQINGVTTLMGAGNTGTGSQRVTIATDQVAIASKAAINTYVDGSIVTIGAKADAKSTATDTTAITMMQVLKQISASVQLPPGGNIAHDAADSGNPVKMGGRASTTPITAVAANDRVDAFLDVQGRQVITRKALTGTASNVSASATNVTVLAANTLRQGATIWNDSTSVLYLKLGATASATSCAVKILADGYYEVPFGYYGIIDGIWASATGAARVTEIT